MAHDLRELEYENITPFYAFVSCIPVLGLVVVIGLLINAENRKAFQAFATMLGTWALLIILRGAFAWTRTETDSLGVEFLSLFITPFLILKFLKSKKWPKNKIPEATAPSKAEVIGLMKSFSIKETEELKELLKKSDDFRPGVRELIEYELEKRQKKST